MNKKKIRAFPIIVGILTICVAAALVWSFKISNGTHSNTVNISEKERYELIKRVKYCNDMFIFVTGQNAMYFCEDFPVSTVYGNELKYYPVRKQVALNTDEMFAEARSCFSSKVISDSKLRQKMFNLGGKSKLGLFRENIIDAVKSFCGSIQSLFSDEDNMDNDYDFELHYLFTMINDQLVYLKSTTPILDERFDYEEANVLSYNENKAVVQVKYYTFDSDANCYNYVMVRNDLGEWQIKSIKLIGSNIRPYYKIS